jgi:Meiotically up-regulated gene 113
MAAYEAALAGTPVREQPPPELIYFAKIGKAIKIGFTTNVERRLKSFRGASAEPIRLIGVFPGGQKLETELHRLFAASRITNEFFTTDSVIREFLSIAKRNSFAAAIQWVRSQRAPLMPVERRAIDKKHYREAIEERKAERRSRSSDNGVPKEGAP